jgi:exportin-7
MLLKLDTVHFILGNHTAAEFPFLDVAANSRLRTTFYSTLCKLLFSDDQVLRTPAPPAPV